MSSLEICLINDLLSWWIAEISRTGCIVSFDNTGFSGEYLELLT